MVHAILKQSPIRINYLGVSYTLSCVFFRISSSRSKPFFIRIDALLEDRTKPVVILNRNIPTYPGIFELPPWCLIADQDGTTRAHSLANHMPVVLTQGGEQEEIIFSKHIENTVVFNLSSVESPNVWR